MVNTFLFRIFSGRRCRQASGRIAPASVACSWPIRTAMNRTRPTPGGIDVVSPLADPTNGLPHPGNGQCSPTNRALLINLP